MSRLKVLHLITCLELGGAQENTLHTATHLDPDRFEALLVAGPGGLLDERARALLGGSFHAAPSLVRPLRPHRDLFALASLISLLRRLKPHIVHTHSSKAGVLGRWAAAAAGVPVRVHSVHGFGFHAGRGSALRSGLLTAERLAYSCTTHWIVVSRANLEQGAGLRLLDPARATLIRSGIDLARFRSVPGGGREVRRQLGLGPADPLVGAISCLKPQKAPLDLVEVAARVAREIPTAHFALAGDGELRREVERLILRRGLAGRFHLLGWRQDVPDLLAAFDLLLHTSRWEGLPRVFPEALASGRPVVATDVDGASEVIEEGVTGHLRPAGDVAGLASCVASLLRDPGRRARMGEEGRRRVGEFDIRDMVRRQEDLYNELATRAGLGAASPGHAFLKLS
jgi:glycosyltransferase involved in cell wall biosynthesis